MRNYKEMDYNRRDQNPIIDEGEYYTLVDPVALLNSTHMPRFSCCGKSKQK
jgi:hypothetical protein